MSDLDPTLTQDAPATRSRLPLLIGLLVAVAALGALAVFVVLPMLTDDGDDTLVEPPATPTESDEGAAPADDPVDQEVTDVPVTVPGVTYEVFLARDPFQPVVPEDEPEAEQAADSEAPDAEDLVVRDDPEAQLCVGEDEVVCNGHVVTLVDVTGVEDEDGPTAVVQVDTTVHEVRRGEPFAERFTLVDVTNSSATIRFVDETFTLMVGDRVLK